MHPKEKVLGQVQGKARGGGGGVCQGSNPTSYPVKSSVLRWHPVLSRFPLAVNGLSLIFTGGREGGSLMA